ncbi:hypothetical protein ACIRL2_30390 [Embleya sp. NPDC127516]|uniref:hypothetical protein n=1 Tax=Embleya sp. NPDC127516 TaxID=3363990 RepID=UPI00382158FE
MAEHDLHDVFSNGAGSPFVLPPRGSPAALPGTAASVSTYRCAHDLRDALNEVDPAPTDARNPRNRKHVEADVRSTP